MNNYDDIINLKHEISSTRRCMKHSDRAAQFALFAALSGYEEAVRETARLTDEKKDVGEEQIKKIDEALRFVKENLSNNPVIDVTYFVKDEKKTGGKYVSFSGKVKNIDEVYRKVIFDGGFEIPTDDIVDVFVV